MFSKYPYKIGVRLFLDLMPCEVAIDLSIEQLDALIEDTIWAFFFSFSVMLCATKLNSNRSSYSIQLSTLGENSSIILAIVAAILKYRMKINLYPRHQFMSFLEPSESLFRFL